MHIYSIDFQMRKKWAYLLNINKMQPVARLIVERKL